MFSVFVSAVPMDLDVKVKATLLGACFLIVSIHDDNTSVLYIPWALHVLHMLT